MTRAQEHGVTLAAGIDVGGTKCLGVVIDSDADITTEHDIKLQVRHPTPHASKLVDALVGLVGELGDFESLGVGVPGLITHDGIMRASPNIPGSVDIEVGPELSARSGVACTSTTTATSPRSANGDSAPVAARATCGWSRSAPASVAGMCSTEECSAASTDSPARSATWS